ncbi:hypothetical protein [Massilia rhizosphaerae]|nr:hypothetical protein [Massilia rhizosphaerae]
MNIHLGVRTLALLAVVAAATFILVHSGVASDPAMNAMLLLSHN